MLIGERVEALRVARGISRKEVSQLSGIDKAHVYMIETGKRQKIYLETAFRLAKALGVTLDELIGDFEFNESRL